MTKNFDPSISWRHKQQSIFNYATDQQCGLVYSCSSIYPSLSRVLVTCRLSDIDAIGHPSLQHITPPFEDVDSTCFKQDDVATGSMASRLADQRKCARQLHAAANIYLFVSSQVIVSLMQIRDLIEGLNCWNML